MHCYLDKTWKQCDFLSHTFPIKCWDGATLICRCSSVCPSQLGFLALWIHFLHTNISSHSLRTGMHVPVGRECAHLLGLCCFLLLSSIHDAVKVWQLPEHFEKHKHGVNRQLAGGLWERICSCAQRKGLILQLFFFFSFGIRFLFIWS